MKLSLPVGETEDEFWGYGLIWGISFFNFFPPLAIIFPKNNVLEAIEGALGTLGSESVRFSLLVMGVLRQILGLRPNLGDKTCTHLLSSCPWWPLRVFLVDRVCPYLRGGQIPNFENKNKTRNLKWM